MCDWKTTAGGLLGAIGAGLTGAVSAGAPSWLAFVGAGLTSMGLALLGFAASDRKAG